MYALREDYFLFPLDFAISCFVTSWYPACICLTFPHSGGYGHPIIKSEPQDYPVIKPEPQQPYPIIKTEPQDVYQYSHPHHPHPSGGGGMPPYNGGGHYIPPPPVIQTPPPEQQQQQPPPQKVGGKKAKEEKGENKLKEKKPRRKVDRFNGMPEEEVVKRTLPDILEHNLDIVIVSFWKITAVNAVNFAGLVFRVWQHRNIRAILIAKNCDVSPLLFSLLAMLAPVKKIVMFLEVRRMPCYSFNHS